MDSQNLMNIAWAYSNLDVQHQPMFSSIAWEATARLNNESQFTTSWWGTTEYEIRANICGLVGALASMDMLTDSLMDAAENVLMSRARLMDRSVSSRTIYSMERATVLEINQVEPRILLEKSHCVVLWKPPGWTVSVYEADDHEEEKHELEAQKWDGFGLPLQSWLVEQFGQQHPIMHDESLAHGCAHRLDRYTSGLLLCSKSYSGYYAAKLQFAARRVRKGYVCVCRGHLCTTPQVLTTKMRIDNKSEKNKPSASGSRAITELVSVAHLFGPDGDAVSLAEINLHTGRYHQIRAHLCSEGHPLVGDKTYGDYTHAWCPRIFLHAYMFQIDMGEDGFDAFCPLPDDLQKALQQCASANHRSDALKIKWVSQSAPVT